MSDYNYSYVHKVVKSEDLESTLNELGASGWRLHTCEPAYMVPENLPEGAISKSPGGVTMYMAVVLEKAQFIEGRSVTTSEGVSAMAMKG